jgi:acyl-CoA thioesterase FadM
MSPVTEAWTVPNSFLSDEMQVYIEDTDAYAVVYNGNYIRMYERALQLSRFCINHPNWFIQTITLHKFKSSPSLGEKFRIHGEANNATTWTLRMMDSSSDPDHGSAKIYNTAQVTLATPCIQDSDLVQHEALSTQPTSLSQPMPGSLSITNSFSIHRDELTIFDITYPTPKYSTDKVRDIHYMLPLRNVLNFFERSRSNFLGGPHVLRQMQIENNILWVVTSIDDLSLHYPSSLKTTSPLIFPGQTIRVKTDAIMKRRGMIVEFHQTAHVEDIANETEGIIIAKGIVNICAIDTVTGKPTSNIPPHIRQLFVQ